MKKISRRDFLKVTGFVGAAAALTACGGSASSTAASTASSAAGSAAASTAALGADTQAIVDRGVLKVGVDGVAFGDVAALDVIAQVAHHLGNAGHSDPADADEMDRADIGADRLHAGAP